MAQFDLTSRMGPFLDRHLVIPLLEFLQNKDIYSEEDILRGKLELLQKTNLVDFAIDIYKQLNNTEETPQAMKTRREQVIQSFKKNKASMAIFNELIENDQLIPDLVESKNFTLEYLQKKYEITEEAIDNLYLWAKLQFECGIYEGAYQSLALFCQLSKNEEHMFNSLWGKVAAGILLGDKWDETFSELQRLRDAIESRQYMSHVQLMQQRAWFIHWSVFVLFNQPNAHNDIFDMLLHEKYVQTIQLVCPHIMRYLAAALIANRKRTKQQHVKDVVHLIEQESHNYSDPITQFVKDLHVTVDFEGAQEHLHKCEAILMNDFFLVSCAKEFLENARVSMFETYCRIHSVIDTTQIAATLGMEVEAAESWIANLIKNARLNAKIDSQSNRIIMTSYPPNAYQQIVAKTDDTTFRTQMIKQNLEKKAQQQQRQQH